MESLARTLSRGLAENAEAVCRHYLSKGHRCGNYWIVGDVSNNAGRSLYVRLKGPLSGKGARGRWTDAATEEYGDLLDLIRAREGLTSVQRHLDEARRFLRATREPASIQQDRRSAECGTVALARKIWAASNPIAGTPAEDYLRARKISADLATRRFAITRRCSIVSKLVTPKIAGARRRRHRQQWRGHRNSPNISRPDAQGQSARSVTAAFARRHSRAWRAVREDR